MLNGQLALHDIGSIEDFCSAALEQQLRRFNSKLDHAERQDALAYLIEETWRLSQRYDPTRSPSFAAYARPFQRRFLIQFYRSRWIDTRNEHRYTDQEWAQIQQIIFPASLDAPVDGHADDGSPGTLGELVAIPDRSLPTDSDTALARAHRERHRHRSRDLAILRAGLLTATAA